MNIFYLDKSLFNCARYHVDKHVVKMILEYAQLLSTAHRVLDGELYVDKTASGRKVKRWKLEGNHLDNILYSATHVNHPSAVWVRSSRSNYDYLSKLLFMLCREYSYRYGKIHKVQSSGLLRVLVSNYPVKIPDVEFTDPPPAMPERYIIPGDVIQSYRNYYTNGKTSMLSWKNRKPPSWITQFIAR